jgi:hypothetical protein
MAEPEQRLNFGFLLVAAMWSFGAAALGSDKALLFFVPVLLLLLPLAFGRYPGEELLCKLRKRVASRGSRKRTSAPAPTPRPSPVLSIPRGGALLAAGLATRPPPAHALT